MRFPHPELEQTGHRPWPLPTQNWIWRQTWKQLLFLHWPVDPAALQARLPPGLEPDLYQGQAWIGVVPFTMQGIAPRGAPALPGFSAFPEINLRTYVKNGDKPGVWFFSLDITHPIAVWAARRWFFLPYFRARMQVRRSGSTTHYRHQRGKLAFSASYHPQGPCAADPGTFAHWATERYCLYTRCQRGHLFRGEVHHRRWPLQNAAVTIPANSFLHDWETTGPMHPQALYAESIHVVVYPLQRLT